MVKKKPPRRFPYVPNKKVHVSDWLPPVNKIYSEIESNSWFDIKYYENPNAPIIETRDAPAPIIPPDSYKLQLRLIKKKIKAFKKRNPKKRITFNKKPVFINTKKIRIYPTNKQKKILNKWFIAFAKMFNCTINYIRRFIYFNNGALNMTVKNARKINNFQNLRKKLIFIRNNLQKQSGKYKIDRHILDEAIHHAVSAYKSCLTNYQKGYIKKFRIREWSTNRRRCIIKMEKGYFKNKKFCKLIFSNISSTENFKNIMGTSILQYNRDTKKYILLVPVGNEAKKIIYQNPEDDCGVDLGVRTFATVYAETGTTAICNDSCDVNKKYNKNFKKYHQKIDKINELLQLKEKEQYINYRKKVNNKIVTDVKIKEINRSTLLKALRKYHNKIVNRVKDMHFKVAHELVNTYDNIYIGKLSTKSILSRNNVKISKKTKRMIGVLSPYLFRQRLMYMGYKYGSMVYEVDEYLTTKTCSNCGKINEIGASKIHKCKCGMCADRDENSAKTHLKIGKADKMGIKRKIVKMPRAKSQTKPKNKRLNKKKIIEV